MVYEYDSKCIMKCVPHPITDIIIIQYCILITVCDSHVVSYRIITCDQVTSCCVLPSRCQSTVSADYIVIADLDNNTAEHVKNLR